MDAVPLKRLLLVALIVFTVTTPVFAQASEEDEVRLMILELVLEEGRPYVIPQVDDSMTNPHYELLGVKWITTSLLWINPSNDYGFSASDAETIIKASATAWDSETSFQVFNYKGTTSKTAGRKDGYNVVSWGRYFRRKVIAVTSIWYTGTTIVETDIKMNTHYDWSLTGEAGKMDVQNIMTHEFGHWCGLADLYEDADYWLTMYGYAVNAETYKRTLGLGDINGLQAMYGA